MLQRESLESSHLTVWRVVREWGVIAGLMPKTRGPKVALVDPRDRKIGELKLEIRRWKARAQRAEVLVEPPKEVSLLLGIVLPAPDEQP